MKNVVLYATDTMADWEYGYAVAGMGMAEDQSPGRYRLVTISDGPADTVTTRGGLRIRPDATLEDLDESNTAMLILPGADTWQTGHDAALGLAARLLERDVPVAAICGATLGLARSGLLNDVAHTSNAAEVLAGVSGYEGASRYADANTVHDGNVITAPATAPVDFARAIFDRLELFPEPILDAWYGLYTTGDPAYYRQLVGQ